jgi:hypothetical protein
MSSIPSARARPMAQAAPQATGCDRSSEDLDAYLHLSGEEIARLVLCLLVEEALGDRLDLFRGRRQNLPSEPI